MRTKAASPRQFRLLTEAEFQIATRWNKRYVSEHSQKKHEQLVHSVLVEGVPIAVIAKQRGVGVSTITRQIQEFVMRWQLRKHSLSLSALLPKTLS